jgi:uncharacterized protein (DUF1778 family)
MVIFDRPVAFRVTKQEHATLQRAAKKNGLRLSQWIREICLAAAARGAHIDKTVHYLTAASRNERGI